MSNESDEVPESKTTFHTKDVKGNPIVVPSDVQSVHVDKTMIVVDENNQQVTLTLLQMHPKPKIDSNGWGLDQIYWDVVGEVKMPISQMNALAVYYINQISGGLDMMPIIQKYLKENPKTKKSGITYGPTEVKQEKK